MAQLKSEPIEDTIDEIDTSMQHLIEEADMYLSSIQNRRSSVNSNSISFDGASSTRESIDYNISHIEEANDLEEPNRTIPPVSVVDRNRNNSSSSSTEDAGSDSTVLYSHEETMPSTPMSSPIVIGDDFPIPEIIILDPSTVGRAPPRRRRQNLCVRTTRRGNVNTSIIDLSHLPSPEQQGQAPVVVISSDEEDDAANQPPVRRMNTSQSPTNMVGIHCGRVSILIGSPYNYNGSNRNSIERSNRNGRDSFNSNIRQQRIEHNYTRGPVELASVMQSLPPPLPLAAVAASLASPRRPSNATGIAPSKDIICPICYETLADRPALSTICGHLFCADCIKRAQQLTKQCPMYSQKEQPVAMFD
uniref:RING-type domain-containing protein n=1 Tax=Anopheles christyi TaxID=43041 RepID=A0A182JY53_9DIPT